ncbi:histone-lysine N-methyltransferase SETD1B [Aplysia californica]|uniref:Histone-lysine N-methyltransferase SETD1B n=1 Tax=Aplysia californica TaxID=6500 RepID=A0ABM1AAP6_APLCA|nr:histone-lysine N-methyltransferase SETD1B [Aplysia californica]
MDAGAKTSTTRKTRSQPWCDSTPQLGTPPTRPQSETAAPPSTSRAAPTHGHATPTSRHAPPTTSRVTPTPAQAPPTYSNTPPTPAQAPPTSNQAPPTSSQAPPTPGHAMRRALRAKFRLVLSENRHLVATVNSYVRQAEMVVRALDSRSHVTPEQFKVIMSRLDVSYSSCVQLTLMAARLFERPFLPSSEATGSSDDSSSSTTSSSSGSRSVSQRHMAARLKSLENKVHTLVDARVCEKKEQTEIVPTEEQPQVPQTKCDRQTMVNLPSTSQAVQSGLPSWTHPCRDVTTDRKLDENSDTALFLQLLENFSSHHQTSVTAGNHQAGAAVLQTPPPPPPLPPPSPPPPPPPPRPPLTKPPIKHGRDEPFTNVQTRDEELRNVLREFLSLVEGLKGSRGDVIRDKVGRGQVSRGEMGRGGGMGRGGEMGCDKVGHGEKGLGQSGEQTSVRPQCVDKMSCPISEVVQEAGCVEVGGEVGGEVCGEMCGDMCGEVCGDMCGEVCGDMCGEVGGNMCGEVGGNMCGEMCGNMCGEVCGNMCGEVCGPGRSVREAEDFLYTGLVGLVGLSDRCSCRGQVGEGMSLQENHQQQHQQQRQQHQKQQRQQQQQQSMNLSQLTHKKQLAQLHPGVRGEHTTSDSRHARTLSSPPGDPRVLRPVRA